MTNFEFCRDSIHSKTTESCLLLFLCTLGLTYRVIWCSKIVWTNQKLIVSHALLLMPFKKHTVNLDENSDTGWTRCRTRRTESNKRPATTVTSKPVLLIIGQNVSGCTEYIWNLKLDLAQTSCTGYSRAIACEPAISMRNVHRSTSSRTRKREDLADACQDSNMNQHICRPFQVVDHVQVLAVNSTISCAPERIRTQNARFGCRQTDHFGAELLVKKIKMAWRQTRFRTQLPLRKRFVLQGRVQSFYPNRDTSGRCTRRSFSKRWSLWAVRENALEPEGFLITTGVEVTKASGKKRIVLPEQRWFSLFFSCVPDQLHRCFLVFGNEAVQLRLCLALWKLH